jgi:hypothetical protein
MMSAAPPGGKGTTIRIGRFGKSCAYAAPAHTIVIKPALNARISPLPSMANHIINPALSGGFTIVRK